MFPRARIIDDVKLAALLVTNHYRLTRRLVTLSDPPVLGSDDTP